jgi:hypothetical protein
MNGSNNSIGAFHEVRGVQQTGSGTEIHGKCFSKLYYRIMFRYTVDILVIFNIIPQLRNTEGTTCNCISGSL